MEFHQTEIMALISNNQNGTVENIQAEKKTLGSCINWTLFKHLILLFSLVAIGIWLQTPSGKWES